MFVLSARNSRKPSSSSTANAWIQQNRKARAITDRNRWYQNEHEIDCNALRLHDFLGVTEKKNLCNEAMRLVEEAVEKEERMAAEYQRKIKTEEQARESEQRQQLLQDEIEANVKKREEQLKALNEQRERERQDFLERKRLQHFIYNCDEIRPQLRQRLLEESKASQLRQIEDRERLKQIEKDRERMWNEVTNRRMHDQEWREKIENQLRSQRESCIIRTLNAQVEEKNKHRANFRDEQSEERRLIDENVREMRANEERRITETRDKQMALRCELQKQKEYNQWKKKQFEEMELAIGRKQAELIQNEFELQRINAINEKRCQREETDKYLEYLRNFRHDVAITEAEKDRIVNEYRQRADEEAYRKREELKKQKKDMEKETYASLWKQISENRERNINEYRQRVQEAIEIRAALQRNALHEQEADKQRRRDVLEYGRELKQQEEVVRSLKKLDIEKDRVYAKKVLEEDNNYRDMARKLLESDINVMPMHPHYKDILKYQSQFE